jgi:hypothetical protein
MINSELERVLNEVEGMLSPLAPEQCLERHAARERWRAAASVRDLEARLAALLQQHELDQAWLLRLIDMLETQRNEAQRLYQRFDAHLAGARLMSVKSAERRQEAGGADARDRCGVMASAVATRAAVPLSGLPPPDKAMADHDLSLIATISMTDMRVGGHSADVKELLTAC